ncbi:hypothetical protein ONZ45_g19002 [Pleurotus djamor]|nr:hypothetical protein ONZ45_g19002 [Pleurotus djamor]
MKLSIAVPLAFFLGVTHVAGHAVVTSPKPRVIGSATQAACGTGAYNSLKSDNTGPIENAVAKIDSGYNAAKCNLYLCRGLQYADNSGNTRVYAPGAVVPFHIDLVAHHTGYANVSIVNLNTQTIIGKPIFNWPVYADESLGPWDWPANETDFEVTIPNLGTQCSTAGTCAIQWWWYAFNRQTYESCVDFTQ